MNNLFRRPYSRARTRLEHMTSHTLLAQGFRDNRIDDDVNERQPHDDDGRHHYGPIG